MCKKCRVNNSTAFSTAFIAVTKRAKKTAHPYSRLPAIFAQLCAIVRIYEQLRPICPFTGRISFI